MTTATPPDATSRSTSASCAERELGPQQDGDDRLPRLLGATPPEVVGTAVAERMADPGRQGGSEIESGIGIGHGLDPFLVGEAVAVDAARHDVDEIGER